MGQHGHNNSGSLQLWACATVIQPSYYTGLTKKGIRPLPAPARNIAYMQYINYPVQFFHQFCL